MDTTMDAGGTEADVERRKGLRRMRTLAVSLLALAAVVFWATRDAVGPLGFLNAGAEAAMVGAIADWFAVTALFKHPLGIPIPHTALVPRRKDVLGRSLQEFVGANFLQEPVIRGRVRAAEVSRRVGEWLQRPGHAERVTSEALTLLGTGLSRIRDEDVSALVEHVMVPRFLEEPVSPVAGALLDEVVLDGAHHGLVDLVLDETHRWLVDNQETFAEIVSERAPWWSPPRLNERVTDRLHSELVAWLKEIRLDPYHHARYALDDLLRRLARDLLHDPHTQMRAERLKERVLSHPQVLRTATALWQATRTAVQAALADTEGLLHRRTVEELRRLGRSLAEDAVLRDRTDRRAADLAVFLVERYGVELTTVISETVDRWDAREAARKIELHVGRDLQFIRINGTVVGFLVGVAIHTAVVVLR